MLNFIKEIIQKHGGRPPGSISEDNAQTDFQEQLKLVCHTTERHRFKAPMTSMLGSLKLFCWGFYISLLLYPFSSSASFVLSLINSIFFVGHFYTYRFWLDFLFPKQESSNVIGTIEPSNEVVSTILIAGHMDSNYEFTFWYYLKILGMVMTVLSGVLIVISPAIFGLDALMTYDVGYTENSQHWFYYIMIALSPVTISMYWIHSTREIDGAQDNLSSIAIALDCAKMISGHHSQSESIPLKHTRIKIVSFGSEEAGLRGSTAYVKDYFNELKTENAVLINLDGIMKVNELVIVTSELATFVRYPAYLIKKMEKAFSTCHQPIKKNIHIIGATDGSAFGMKGLPAITLIGQNIHHLHESYHTRLDTIEHVENEALIKTRDIILAFIKAWDKEISEETM